MSDKKMNGKAAPAAKVQEAVRSTIDNPDHTAAEPAAIDLDRFRAEIQESEPTAPPGQTGDKAAAGNIAPAHPNDKFRVIIRRALGVVVIGASRMYPFVTEHYTPEVCAGFAESIVDACNAYDVDMSKILGKDGGKVEIWFNLFMTGGLPFLGCMQSYRAMKKAAAETDAQNRSTSDDQKPADTQAPAP